MTQWCSKCDKPHGSHWCKIACAEMAARGWIHADRMCVPCRRLARAVFDLEETRTVKELRDAHPCTASDNFPYS